MFFNVKNFQIFSKLKKVTKFRAKINLENIQPFGDFDFRNFSEPITGQKLSNFDKYISQFQHMFFLCVGLGDGYNLKYKVK